MRTGIYLIKSPSNKVYIGQSRVIENRWKRHKESRRTSKLYSSLRKYGWRNHEFKVLHELPKDISQDVLNTYEEIYMDAFSASYELLNIRKAGSLGKFSKEHRDNLSKSHKGKIPWNKGLRNSQVAWNKGLYTPKKVYYFIKDNNITEIFGLRRYCDNMGLNYDSMIAVHLQKQKQHKGYFKHIK